MDSVHGLSYPDGLLNVLPVLDAPKDSEEPIRALSAPQFADLHLQHTLAHPPDNVLFPFLHGLEGDNHAQNTFFASSSSTVAQGHSQSFHHHHHVHAHAHKITPRIPKYRGLVWVVCEDDLQKVGDGVTLRVLRRKPLYDGGVDGFRLTPPSTSSSSLSSEESDTSSFEDDFEDEDEEDEEMLMITDDVASLKSYAAAGGSSFGIISDLQVRAEVDPNPDAEGIHSVLGPPSTQMDVDFHVRVHVSGGDANPVSSSSRAFSEGGVSAYDERTTGQATLHFEGSHMHPVSHRAPVPSGANAHLNHMHPHGLGINIPTLSDTTSTSSSASTSTSTPSSAGSTPNSSIFSSDSPCSESSLTSPNTASSLGVPTPIRASSEEENCPLTPCANPRPLDLERSPPLSARSLSSIRSLKMRKVCLDPRMPPLLTSTFRPKELVRKAGVAGVHKYQIPAREELERVRQGLRVHPFRPPVRVEVGARAEKNEQGEKGKDKEKEEDTWEFVPARVPDGISLRNFGIQVPIYATLSDIVIYSPYGVTSAVLALARRFRAAIKAKRRERMKRAGIDVDLLDEPDDDDSYRRDAQESANETITHDEAYTGIERTYAPSHHPTEEDITHPRPFILHPNTHTEITIPAASKADLKAKAREAAAEFVQYRVFVLDSSEEEMREEMPHLMMRMYCEGEASVGGRTLHTPAGVDLARKENNGTAKRSYDASSAGTEPGHGFATADPGAHTDGSDGHIVELGVVEEEDKRRRLKAEERKVGMDVDEIDGTDAGMDLDLPLQTHGQEKEEEQDLDEVLRSIPNTVDFTLREKEEMRNLTKASEIISLYPESVCSASSSTTVTRVSSSTHLAGQPHLNSHPFFTSPLAAKGPIVENDHATIPAINARFDSRVGQVYLGNSGDVPLAPDLSSQFRHAASVPRDVEEEVSAKCSLKTLTRHLRGVEGSEKEYGVDEEEEDVDSQENLPHDDPFNYIGTNDPAKGFGFDVCIECHDLAPFPNAAHLRAAEDHLGMLDALWREKWEAAWYAKEEQRMRKVQSELAVNDATSNSPRIVFPPPAPPRPPPHANAVIHLPFPSSPPNTQTTMVALLPIIRFLEKWIRPVPPASKATAPNTPPDLNNLITVRTVGTKKNMTDAPVSSSGPPSKSPSSSGSSGSRRWSSVSSLLPSFPSFSGVGGGGSNKDQQPQQQPQLQQTNSNVGGANLNATHLPPTPPPNAPPLSHPSPRNRSLTSPAVQYPHAHMYQLQARTRPLKVLMYSSDGYTESSVPALCLLMVIKGLGLPEAYLELQIGKKRSFFAYQTDLGILKRVEGRLREEREREKEREKERERERMAASGAYSNALSSGNINANGKRTAVSPPSSGLASATRAAAGVYWSGATKLPSGNSGSYMGRPAAKSISFARPPPASPSLPPPAEASHSLDMFRGSESLPSQTSMLPHSPSFSTSDHYAPNFTSQQVTGNNTAPLFKGRPRASTSPWLPSLFGDHQSWFNDPRFDGSFPSQVLPFLYLGNLNHASNVYMLHALGITHVVSVGECALVPPTHHLAPHAAGTGVCAVPSSGTHHIPGRGFSSHGSLWIEEREGRIKVMDIKGVCDDGIDTLEPQLEPICDWIDKARQEGGQVLVHCRVGVSRSATVTIAYVMKHLNVPLVDAYLIVRSRRLSVLIQPNMRLLYNLCGWEIKLAKERAKDNKWRLLKELSRTLTWSYLAKEVHALNEKYLH